MNRNRDDQLQQLADKLSLIQRFIYGKFSHRIDPLTPVLIKVIRIIGKRHEVNIKYIAEYLSITSGAATQHITALEAMGAVQRTISKHDRREIVVSLTEKGTELNNQIKQTTHEILGEVFAPLTEAELEKLIELITKVSNKYNKVN